MLFNNTGQPQESVKGIMEEWNGHGFESRLGSETLRSLGQNTALAGKPCRAITFLKSSTLCLIIQFTSNHCSVAPGFNLENRTDRHILLSTQIPKSYSRTIDYCRTTNTCLLPHHPLFLSTSRQARQNHPQPPQIALRLPQFQMSKLPRTLRISLALMN